MAAGEITLETLTADAENESQNVWSFAFEADKTSLGARYERRAQQCIDEDRPIPETEVVYGRTPSR
eukprot:scaffold248996_cov35-Attheya_sp.AAC.1